MPGESVETKKWFNRESNWLQISRLQNI